ncbi:hypothetical protein G9C85_03775 [Halorubellus sp. JP-L1]|uniref:hypothetical protein n=1 Tax=Halorubellus sp. JP-L1 TaxID=2715753 RepID=UPI001408015C|nr:hypothetical protein [Halorubellus sp. JP-L1]NHN40754.1 hypothetical protein [Halorubellus sp. JP-L1]
MPTFREYRGWEYAPLRFVVWVLAAVYLGRVHYDNTLWDLRQLSAFEVVVKTLSIAVVLAFVYWNVALADPDVVAIVWAGVVVFGAKVLLVLGVVRAGTALAGRRQFADRRRFEAASGPDDDGE